MREKPSSEAIHAGADQQLTGILAGHRAGRDGMNAEYRDSVALPADSAPVGLAPPIEASATEPPNQQGRPSPRTAAAPRPPASYGKDPAVPEPRPASPATPTAPARTPHPSRAGNPTRAAEFLDGLEALVEQARAGHPRAMTELIRRFTPLVRAVVRRAGIYGAEAEDVEQETWLRLATNLDRVHEPAALPRWLSVTAGRLCTSLFDKRRRVQPAGDFSEDVWLSNERWSDRPTWSASATRSSGSTTPSTRLLPEPHPGQAADGRHPLPGDLGHHRHAGRLDRPDPGAGVAQVRPATRRSGR